MSKRKIHRLQNFIGNITFCIKNTPLQCTLKTVKMVNIIVAIFLLQFKKRCMDIERLWLSLCKR